MVQGTLKIHTENILPIIKKWLYSDKDIFVRELVSNACDALSKLKILAEKKEVEYEEKNLRIDLTLDKKNKTLTIADNGIGMTSDEVEKYIAQIAFSGAEEFLNKYQTNQEKDQMIGHFGLGFYSAYMVASNVEIDTLSYLSNVDAAYWCCDGTSQYTLEKGVRNERGTTITLHLEDEEYLEEIRLKDILERYCAFLPYPIFLNNVHINNEQPLWLKAPSACTDQEYLEFYRKLYPLDPDPIFWVHLNIDYPFHLKGILFFPKIHRRFDYQKSHLKLFCNRVFVSESCQDLIPDYLAFLRGAIDSPDIPLNVSRSYLQMDRTVRSLSAHISKKVADRLTSLYQTQRDTFLKHWEDIETIIKLGAMQDDKFFEKVKDLLVWQTIKGDWINIKEYQEQHGEAYKNKIFYTQDTESSFLSLYKEKNLDVLVAKNPLDTPLMNFLEMQFRPAKFQRIDGALDPSLLDAAKEKTLLDSQGRTESANIADFVRKCLSQQKLEIEAKSLANSTLPAFLVIDEETRRLRDTMAITSSHRSTQPLEKKTFVVNTNNPLINSLYKHPDHEFAKEVFTHLYQLSLLSQKELPPKEFPELIERSNKILSKLLSEKRTG